MLCLQAAVQSCDVAIGTVLWLQLWWSGRLVSGWQDSVRKHIR